MAINKLINKSDTVKKTKTMEISIHSFKLLQDHSKKYHSAEEQPVSYDQCIYELCSFWNEQHNSTCRHLTRY
jgi:hypothetical protein